MQSLRDIRRRIKSVQSTRQIARAMEMVSAARFKRAQSRLLEARPYAEKMEGVVGRISSAGGEQTHVFLAPRDVRTVGICVLASDRGLCGSFNTNVIAAAEELARRKRAPAGGDTKAQRGSAGEVSIHFLPVGRKASLYFRRRQKEFLGHFPELGAFADVALARKLTATLTRCYTDGRLDEIWLVYTHFVSSGTRRVVSEQLLPIAGAKTEDFLEGYGYIFEPPAGELLDVLLPRYIGMRVFMTIAESCASEQSARMVAMSFATKNADDMTYDLTLQRNRARQSAITREIADIVGTAEVLR